MARTTAENKVFQTFAQLRRRQKFRRGAKSRVAVVALSSVRRRSRESLRGKRVGNFLYNGPRKGNSLKWVKADSARSHLLPVHLLVYLYSRAGSDGGKWSERASAPRTGLWIAIDRTLSPTGAREPRYPLSRGCARRNAPRNSPTRATFRSRAGTVDSPLASINCHRGFTTVMKAYFVPFPSVFLLFRSCGELPFLNRVTSARAATQ